MKILNILMPHKLIQEIMYVDVKDFKLYTKNLRKQMIKIEYITEENVEKFNPSDNYFNLKKIYNGKGKFFFGATLNGCPVAFGGIIIKGGSSMYFKIKSDVYFEGLYTFPEYRGMGIMPILMKEMIKIVSEKVNINRLALCVRPDNIGAKKLYEKLGFKTDKTVSFFIKCGMIMPYYTV